MFVNSQAWVSEASFPLHFLGVTPSPRLGLHSLPFSFAGLGPIWWYLLYSFSFTFPSIQFCDVSLLLALHMGCRQSSFSWSALYLRRPSSPHCSFGSSSYLPSMIVSIFLCCSTTTRILYSLSPYTHSTSKPTLFLHSLSPSQAPGLPCTLVRWQDLLQYFFIIIIISLFHSGT